MIYIIKKKMLYNFYIIILKKIEKTNIICLLLIYITNYPDKTLFKLFTDSALHYFTLFYTLLI